MPPVTVAPQVLRTVIEWTGLGNIKQSHTGGHWSRWRHSQKGEVNHVNNTGPLMSETKRVLLHETSEHSFTWQTVKMRSKANRRKTQAILILVHLNDHREQVPTCTQISTPTILKILRNLTRQTESCLLGNVRAGRSHTQLWKAVVSRTGILGSGL